MSKLFDIAAIILITAPATFVQAGVSDVERSNSPAVHRLCILDDASSRGESVQFENYTDTPDFNVVHSEVLFQQQPDTDELRSITIVNSMPQLLEQPQSKPSAFMYLINF